MIHHHLREVEALFRYRVIDRYAPLGPLRGLLFDPAGFKVDAFVVAGGDGTDEPAVVAASGFRKIDDRRRELVFEVSPESDVDSSNQAGTATAPGLQDAARLTGREIEGRDRVAGTIVDLLVNVDVWEMRYFVIETGTGRVLTDIEWSSSFGDDEENPRLDLPAAAVAEAPRYRSLDELCSGYEEALYRHYTRRIYAPETRVA